MNPRNPALPLPLIALCSTLAAVGGGLVATLLTQGPPSPAGIAPGTPGVTDTAVRTLTERIAALEQQLAAPVAERADGDAVVLRAPADPELRQRVEQLEQRLDELAQRPATPASAVLPDLRRTETTPEQRLLAQQQERQLHQTALLDPAATEQARIEAWRGLRRIPDSYDDAVVAVITQLGLSSADAATRADVWRQADSRSKHPAIATALLQALQSDAAANAREEAAETLGIYLDSPGVRQALELAAQSDADEKVRRQASSSLNASKR